MGTAAGIPRLKAKGVSTRARLSLAAIRRYRSRMASSRITARTPTSGDSEKHWPTIRAQPAREIACRGRIEQTSANISSRKMLLSLELKSSASLTNRKIARASANFKTICTYTPHFP